MKSLPPNAARFHQTQNSWNVSVLHASLAPSFPCLVLQVTQWHCRAAGNRIPSHSGTVWWEVGRDSRTHTAGVEKRSWSSSLVTHGKTEPCWTSQSEHLTGRAISKPLMKKTHAVNFESQSGGKKPPPQRHVLHHCGRLFLTLLHFQFHVIIDVVKDYPFPRVYDLIVRKLITRNEESSFLILHQTVF